MNCTPNEYVTSYRLEQAVSLLRGSQMTMTEIANACGFNSPSYFAEVFSKHKGCCPSTFRKRYR